MINAYGSSGVRPTAPRSDHFFDEGLELDQRFVELEPDNAVGHYNLACSLALKNRQEDAITTLRTAFEKGYRDFGWMMEDADLKGLHDNPAFSALLAEYRVQQ